MLLRSLPIKFCPSSGHCWFRTLPSVFIPSNIVTWFLVFCPLLCRKESLENKKNNKPEVNQIANSDNKVYTLKYFSPFCFKRLCWYHPKCTIYTMNVFCVTFWCVTMAQHYRRWLSRGFWVNLGAQLVASPYFTREPVCLIFIWSLSFFVLTLCGQTWPVLVSSQWGLKPRLVNRCLSPERIYG